MHGHVPAPQASSRGDQRECSSGCVPRQARVGTRPLEGYHGEHSNARTHWRSGERARAFWFAKERTSRSESVGCITGLSSACNRNEAKPEACRAHPRAVVLLPHVQRAQCVRHASRAFPLEWASARAGEPGSIRAGRGWACAGRYGSAGAGGRSGPRLHQLDSHVEVIRERQRVVRRRPDGAVARRRSARALLLLPLEPPAMHEQRGDDALRRARRNLS
jgi:hypothetical protein